MSFLKKLGKGIAKVVKKGANNLVTNLKSLSPSLAKVVKGDVKGGLVGVIESRPSVRTEQSIKDGLKSTAGSLLSTKLIGGGGKPSNISANPILNRLFDTVKTGGADFIKRSLTNTYTPSVLKSPLVDQFNETKTGLQQSVFGSPVSDSYNKLVDVSWGGGGLEDFNVSTGGKDEKTQSVPVWVWIGGGILAFFGMLAMFGKIKFR